MSLLLVMTSIRSSQAGSLWKLGPTQMSTSLGMPTDHSIYWLQPSHPNSLHPIILFYFLCSHHHCLKFYYLSLIYYLSCLLECRIPVASREQSNIRWVLSERVRGSSEVQEWRWLCNLRSAVQIPGLSSLSPAESWLFSGLRQHGVGQHFHLRTHSNGYLLPRTCNLIKYKISKDSKTQHFMKNFKTSYIHFAEVSILFCTMQLYTTVCVHVCHIEVL